MKVIEFVDDIKLNCSEIAYMCTYHICKKIYKNIEKDEDDKENILNIFHDYNMVLKYLNDYAGVIYRRYSSSTQEVYNELCTYHNLSLDNISTFEYIIKKLQKQTPQLLMGLEDRDIQIQTINNYEDKLNHIKSSKYFKENISSLEMTIEQLESNISLVKRALQL